MKALITGVSGFVGGYLSEYLLSNGVEVWGTKLPNEQIDYELSKKITIRNMNMTDNNEVIQVIKECQPEFVFHLAAQSSVALSWKLPQLTVNVNITGTLNLLEAIKSIKPESRILLIGSSEQYGKIKPEDIPVAETHALDPSNPYAVSKIAQEMLAQQYVKAYGMNIIMVRAFNHIGPKQAPIFVVADFAKRIAEIEKGNLEPVLRVGNLEAERDFTDVRDIVRAYFKIIQEGIPGEVYNVGSGRCFKVKDILNILLAEAKVDINVEVDPEKLRPIDMPIIQCDNRKLKGITEWEPKYALEETLGDVLEYWRNTI